MKIKFNIRDPSDWGKVTLRDIRNSGGSSILSVYEDSLFTCLQANYPGLDIFLLCNMKTRSSLEEGMVSFTPKVSSLALEGDGESKTIFRRSEGETSYKSAQ